MKTVAVWLCTAVAEPADCHESSCRAEDLFLMHLGSAVHKPPLDLQSAVLACYDSTSHSAGATTNLSDCISQKMGKAVNPKYSELVTEIKTGIKANAGNCACADVVSDVLANMFIEEVEHSFIECNSLFVAMRSNVSLVPNADVNGVCTATGAQPLGSVSQLAHADNTTAPSPISTYIY